MIASSNKPGGKSKAGNISFYLRQAGGRSMLDSPNPQIGVPTLAVRLYAGPHKP
jgi:hypothetical protein